MKTVLSALIIVALSLTAFAGSFIDIGFRMEKTFADLTAFEYQEEEYFKLDGDAGSENAYNFGFYTRINLFIFSIQPEIYYLHGVKSLGDITGINGNNQDNVNTVLEIPILIRMQFYGWLFNLSLIAGPSFSVPVTEGGLSLKDIWNVIERDAKEFNFLAVIGVGIDFPLNNLRFSTDGRVIFGLESKEELERNNIPRRFKISLSFGIGFKTF